MASIAAAGFAGGGPSASALFHLRRLQTFEDKKRSALDAMAYSASVGPHRASRRGVVPDAGAAAPEPDAVEPRSVPHVRPWLALHREGRTIVRLQMNFLQNQNDPALPELKERLRNQFQFFGDDMMMTGVDRRVGRAARRAAPSGARRSAWSRRPAGATRTASRIWPACTQVVEAYEAVNKEFDITGLRWMVAPRAASSTRIC